MRKRRVTHAGTASGDARLRSPRFALLLPTSYLRRILMTLTRSSILGAGIGATSMFLLDPARGARRRALLRDKMTSASRKTAEAASATFRDLSNRFEGVQSRTRKLFAADTVDD